MANYEPIVGSLADKFVGVPAILHVYKDHKMMKVAAVSMFSFTVAPLHSALVVYQYRDFPFTLAWHVSDSNACIRLVASLTDWLLLVAGSLLNLAFVIIVIEAAVTITFITTSLR